MKSEKAWLFSQPRIRVEAGNLGVFLTSRITLDVFTQPGSLAAGRDGRKQFFTHSVHPVRPLAGTAYGRPVSAQPNDQSGALPMVK